MLTCLIKGQSTSHFGREDISQLLSPFMQDNTITEHASSVNDPCQGSVLSNQRAQQLLNRLAITDINLAIIQAHTWLSRRDEICMLCWTELRASHQDYDC